MKFKRRNQFLSSSAAISLAITAPSAFAVDFTWDADPGTAGAQDGNGTWENGQPNWLDTTSSTDNQNWADGNTNKATFGAGTDGTYAITLVGTPQMGGGLVFNNSGYTLSGSALSLRNGTGSNGTITVNANNTATINSTISYNSNKSTNLNISAGGILNLGGGAGNSQYKFAGAGMVNITAGNYEANTGYINVAEFNQTGGNYKLNQGNNIHYDIGIGAAQDVNYTISGGNLTSNANSGTHTTAYLNIGRTTGNFTSTLTVKSGATVEVGTTAAGQLRIGGNADSNGVLDVQGGTLTVGTNKTANKLYFFVAGADADRSAVMTQSGGTVTAGGIQFGGSGGTYDATSSASLTLSGGSLYVGADGITQGSGASALPTSIILNGGTLGADEAWSSSLDMKLGTAGGGVTIKAASEANANGNITLSGILSNDGAANGTLTKTGGGTLTLSGAAANTYTGLSTVSAGTLALNKTAGVDAIAGNLSIGGATLSNTASNQIADTATVTMDGTAAKWSLNGNSETVATLNMINAGSTVANGLATGSAGKLDVSGTLTHTLGDITLNSSGVGNESIISVGTLINTGGDWTFGVTNGTQSLVIGAGGLTIGGGSTIAVNASANSSNFISLGGDVTSQSNAIDNTISGAGELRLNATRTFDVADGAAASDLTIGLTVANGNATGGIIKTGNGTLTLSGNNTYTDNTTIDAGTLEVQDSIATSGGITNNAALVFNSASAQSYGNAMDGNGTLEKKGAGNLTLSGNSNLYLGSTTVSDGTLILSHNNAAGTGGISLTGNTSVLSSVSGINVANNITLKNAGAKVERVLAASDAYSTGTSGSLASEFSGGTPDTTAQILDGTSTSGGVFSMSFSGTSAALNDAAVRRSDVFTTSGTGSDTYVIQLLTSGGFAADSKLGFFDGTNWVNAGTNFVGNTAWVASTYSVGDYGFDNTTGSVWGVVGTGGSFSAIPEPTSALVGLLIAAGLLRRRRNA